jgi:predicted nucleic acid-binding protein
MWIPEGIGPVVVEDPADDEVLACALAAKVDAIVSGDRHVLGLKAFQGISILTPSEFLALLDRRVP